LYGENIGIAFQIIDDILDITQDSATLGKTAGKDEAMNKLTYPKLLGLEGAYKEAERLTSIAKKALSAFGDRATPLIAIADRIVDPSQITYE
jgi:geranylgeranyl pyrophosphate synthase